MTLLTLAARVEAGDGDDREMRAVDGWIYARLNPDVRWIIGHEEGRFPQEPIYGSLIEVMEAFADKADAADYINAPHYTRSLDAAMSPLPEGWAIESLSYWPAPPPEADNAGPSQATARLVGTSLERFGKRLIWGHSGKDGRAEGTAATMSRALVAASLRARHAMGVGA